MHKMLKRALVGFLFFVSASGHAESFVIKIKAGDNQALIDAINDINAQDSLFNYFIDIETGPNGETGFDFTEAYDSSNNALPTITARIVIRNRLNDSTVRQVSFTGSGQRDFRLFSLEGDSSLNLSGLRIQNFGINGENGGAILVTGNGRYFGRDCLFRNNFSNMNGGAIACTGQGYIGSMSSEYVDNRASNLGGAISLEGNANAHFGFSVGNVFRDNNAGVFGCDLNIQTAGIISLEQNVFEGGNCENVNIENPFGRMEVSSNTFAHAGNAIDSTATAALSGNVFQGPAPGNQPNSQSPTPPKPQAACNDFGSGAFVSKGHNIASDNSCALNQLSDQPNTDPLLSLNQNGLPVLNPGSPAIDAGSAVVMIPDDQGLAVLPCGYVDINGMARPQDGDADGNFECDSGASEFLGMGSVQAGHSGAFYNGLRSGEGNYVEILSDELAVVYTFSFRPDGSGPSWFIGVGDIRDNSIVIEELLRPTGTSFGDGFDPAAIDYSDAGGMSMIFPDCDATDGGSVAYSGSPELGYEGLLSRAQRITSITGCGKTPAVNAGLSGSFYNPARSGEGLIVEWMTNGDVVAIFFTYDQNGDQFWTFGVGTPTGTSVTIDAIYPAASTVWGRNFNTGDVDLQPWGTFNLNWTDCDNLDFNYTSTLPGYGSGSHDYTRISNLQNTTCPPF